MKRLESLIAVLSFWTKVYPAIISNPKLVLGKKISVNTDNHDDKIVYGVQQFTYIETGYTNVTQRVPRLKNEGLYIMYQEFELYYDLIIPLNYRYYQARWACSDTTRKYFSEPHKLEIRELESLSHMLSDNSKKVDGDVLEMVVRVGLANPFNFLMKQKFNPDKIRMPYLPRLMYNKLISS